MCTHTVQYMRKQYVHHTDNAQAAAAEAEKSQQAEWVFSVKGGLSVLADGWWRKKGMG